MFFARAFKSERRRRIRQSLNRHVQVLTASGHMAALGINVSDVGMRLFTVADLPLGSQIQVEFIPPRSAEVVRLGGVVRHRALYLYGIEFLVDSGKTALGSTDARGIQEPAGSSPLLNCDPPIARSQDLSASHH